MSNQTSKDFPDAFYRVTVKGLYVKDGKVLLLKEKKEDGEINGEWEIPGGGLDFGEEAHDGLRREIEEEMGLKVKKISKSPVYAWTWRYENKRSLDWYYSLVLCYQVELENLEFKPSNECVEIGFFSKEELSGLKLRHQANGLRAVFNKDDFECPF